MYIVLLCIGTVLGTVPRECPKVAELKNSHDSLNHVILSVEQAEADSRNYLGRAIRLAASLGHPITSAEVTIVSGNNMPSSVTMPAVMELFRSGSETIVPELTTMFELRSSEEVISVLSSFVTALDNDLKRVPVYLRTLKSDLANLYDSLRSEYRVCLDTLDYDRAILQSRIRRLSGQIDSVHKRFPDINQCLVSEISSAVQSHYLAPLEEQLGQAESDLRYKIRSMDDIQILLADTPADRSMSFV